jgi:hypothetical protein
MMPPHRAGPRTRARAVFVGDAALILPRSPTPCGFAGKKVTPAFSNANQINGQSEPPFAQPSTISVARALASVLPDRNIIFDPTPLRSIRAIQK